MDAFNFRKPDAYKNISASQIKVVEEVEEDDDINELENQLKNVELDDNYCIIL